MKMDAVLENYGLNPSEYQISSLGEGLINSTWKVSNGRNEYVLQKVNTAVFKHPEFIAENIHTLGSYLSKNKPEYLFLDLIPTRSMHYGVLTENGYYRLFPFIKDSHTINISTDPKEAYEAAVQFGRFTKNLADFPAEKLKITLPDFHNLLLRYDQYVTAIHEGNPQRIEESQEWINILKNFHSIVTDFEAILQNPSFKIRVTHHDTKISNVLFDQNNKGLCVIDLDTVMPGYFISDVGDMMRTYLSPVSEEEKDFSQIKIREEYFEAIYNGYISEMKDALTKEEKINFIYSGKFMIYMQAIRFLADHLQNDVYYGAKYEGQNLIRAANQVTLLQRLTEKEESLLQRMR